MRIQKDKIILLVGVVFVLLITSTLALKDTAKNSQNLEVGLPSLLGSPTSKFGVEERRGDEKEISPSVTLSSGMKIRVGIADSFIERSRGLSGRASLSDDEGLLFIFNEPGSHGIWMKDMLFPIDIIWLDEHYKIVDVKEGAAPESYPDVFYPQTPANFVLEVAAGFIGEHALQRGDRLFWSDGKGL